MNQKTIYIQPVLRAPVLRAKAASAAALALMFGIFVLAGVGFAGSSILHNAAHDSRHSFAFPCH
jgi:cobalt transporter subunit CbtB